MRISDLISLGKEYLLLGSLLILILLLGFFLGYFLVYRRLLKGTKRIAPKRLVLPAVFLLYLFIVLGATMLSRSQLWSAGAYTHLFSSYREAWNHFSASYWRSLILNICMFVPFGFLLPFLFKRCQKFWLTYLCGFLFTLSIELLQLLLQRGIFDIDDIINNLAGAMIGYGLYRLLRLVSDKYKKRPGNPAAVLCFQFPLLAVITVFTVIFIAYSRKEFGNLSCAYNYAHKVTVESQLTYDDQAGDATVYRFRTLSLSDTEAFAEEFFARLGVGIDASRTDIYEDTAIYYSDNDNRYSLWIDYAGGSYTYTDFDALDYDGKTAVVRTEAEVRADLAALGIIPPEECSFTASDGSQYQFSLVQAQIDGSMYDGTITCVYGTDDALSVVHQLLLSCSAYREVSLISEQDAAAQIAAGKFYYYTDDDLSVELGAVSIEYQKDTKGYYQPVYLFESLINGEESQIAVPAICP